MATGQLSVKITVSGADYYVSDEEFLASNAVFHYGFILTAPVVELSTTKGGYANFKVGSLVLENRPNDANHPFGSSRYKTMLDNTETAYNFVLKLTLNGYDWITGILILESINQEALTFTLYPKEYTVSPVGTVTDSGGNTVTAPWIYGAVSHFNNLVQTGATTFQNPTGLTSGLTFYEDGSSESISLSTSTITCGTYGGGQPTLSSSTTQTLEDFFDYVATQLSLDVSTANTAKATNASSLSIKIRQDKQDPLIEIASKVSESFNYQFYIAVDPDNT